MEIWAIHAQAGADVVRALDNVEHTADQKEDLRIGRQPIENRLDGRDRADTLKVEPQPGERSFRTMLCRRLEAVQLVQRGFLVAQVDVNGIVKQFFLVGCDYIRAKLRKKDVLADMPVCAAAALAPCESCLILLTLKFLIGQAARDFQQLDELFLIAGANDDNKLRFAPVDFQAERHTATRQAIEQLVALMTKLLFEVSDKLQEASEVCTLVKTREGVELHQSMHRLLLCNGVEKRSRSIQLGNKLNLSWNEADRIGRAVAGSKG